MNNHVADSQLERSRYRRNKICHGIAKSSEVRDCEGNRAGIRLSEKAFPTQACVENHPPRRAKRRSIPEARENSFPSSGADIYESSEEDEEAIVSAITPEPDERFRQSSQPHTPSLGPSLSGHFPVVGLAPDRRYRRGNQSPPAVIEPGRDV